MLNEIDIKTILVGVMSRSWIEEPTGEGTSAFRIDLPEPKIVIAIKKVENKFLMFIGVDN